ncbi:hypothetical protein [Dokdonella sp.]|uniref:hypothetical protein n=1 Tax=Dokdonella sp. TaxID=2291710 RepID=UPI003783EA17
MSTWLWIPGIAFVIGGLMHRPKSKRSRRADDLWDDETPIPLDHYLVPEEIRHAVQSCWFDGCSLHRTQTRTGIEWWLLDDTGELIEAFWIK